MKIDDLPNTRGNQYTQRITVPLTSDDKQWLDGIKKDYGKDLSAILRMLIADFRKKLEFPEAG